MHGGRSGSFVLLFESTARNFIFDLVVRGINHLPFLKPKQDKLVTSVIIDYEKKHIQDILSFSIY